LTVRPHQWRDNGTVAGGDIRGTVIDGGHDLLPGVEYHHRVAAAHTQSGTHDSHYLNGVWQIIPGSTETGNCRVVGFHQYDQPRAAGQCCAVGVEMARSKA